MPSKIRCLLCLLYELITLLTLWLKMTFIYLYINAEFFETTIVVLQISLWFTSGIYLIYCWANGGQTLAMKAWKIKLINKKNKSNLNFFTLRYLLSTLSLIFLGLGFLYMLFDKKNRYLHDRILGSKIIFVQT